MISIFVILFIIISIRHHHHDHQKIFKHDQTTIKHHSLNSDRLRRSALYSPHPQELQHAQNEVRQSQEVEIHDLDIGSSGYTVV